MSKLRRGIIIVLTIIIGINIIEFSLKFFWIIAELPTSSSAGKLILTRDADFEPKKIVLKHYLNKKHICDYELELTNCLYNQTSHVYKLPEIKDGYIEVNIYLDNSKDNIIAIRYEDVAKLYRKGILIYCDSYYRHDEKQNNPSSDRYIHFVSGSSRKSFFCSAYETDWKAVDKSPKLKKYVVPERMAYFPGDNNCDENKWKRQIDC